MRIGIDCRLAGKKHGGIGRYIEQLVTQLVQHAEYSWVIFFHDKEQYKSCFPEGLPSIVEIHFVPIKHYSVAEQLKLPFVFYKAKLDLLHIPHFNVPLLYLGKKIVTIHDLLWHQHRGSRVTTLNPMMYWFKYLFYRIIASWSVLTATKILVPSETIKKTLLNEYVGAKHKIIVTKEGFDLTTSQKTVSSEVKSVTTEPYLLYVGSLYPHKNVSLVIDALHHLPNISLFLVGSRTVFQNNLIEKVKFEKLENRVKFLGYLPDEDLAYLYNHATAVVQPSVSEGFGLTGVEAMAFSTPLLASDIPIFKEIYQAYAIYFDPSNVNSFVKAYNQIRNISKKDLTTTASTILKEYSWEQMAKRTLKAYTDCLTSESQW